MDLKTAQTNYNAIVSMIADTVVNATGKLAGWDIALKDNINMVGTLTTASCRYLSNYQSVYNAEIVDRLKGEGALMVAKTSMDELGMGGTNLSALTGPVWNPYDTTRISGGSSGGSAALVAAKAVRAAIGTDTGDSVRKPAAYCGVVGLKPTYGRISRYGVIPYASSLDHVGLFTQNVTDARLLLEVLAGRDDKDMTSSQEPVPIYSESETLDLKGKRIGFFKTVHNTMTHPEIQKHLETLKQTLSAQGAIIVEKEMDVTLLRAALATYTIVSNSEAVTNHANLDGVRFGMVEIGDSLAELMTKTRSAGFSTTIKERFIYGAYGLSDDNQEEVLNKAKRVRRLLVDTYQTFFSDVDIVVALASGHIAPTVAEVTAEDKLSDAYLIGENHMVLNNFSGFPSLTLPLGLVEGMPIGVNLTTLPFTETRLFAYAQHFETLIDWKGAF